jgi:hypothetical protein
MAELALELSARALAQLNTFNPCGFDPDCPLFS